MDDSTLPPGKNRHPQIEMAVEYLSLRMHLSAFDRFIRFHCDRTLNEFRIGDYWKNKGSAAAGRTVVHPRDYVRHRSRHLKKAFASNGEYRRGGHVLADAPQDLSPAVLEAVGRIVGKTYTAGSLIRHRIYETWADSVRFRTASSTYTEANAGSGETAVVRVVMTFERAQPNTLLLIDEPETSLHPGAQAELLAYMLGKIKEKRLQVVVATHAPAFVRPLPPSAIKVLVPGADGLVGVLQNVTPEDAFFEIGHVFDPRCNIVVEDKLAKALLEEVARSEGGALASKVKVEFGPGGVAVMRQDIAVYMKDTAVVRPVLVFDGDQRKDHADVRHMASSDLTPANLDQVIVTQAGSNKIRLDQDNNSSDEVKVGIRKKYLEYFRTHVLYLPFASPEQELWSDDAAGPILAAAGLSPAEVAAKLAAFGAAGDFKARFAALASAAGPGLHPQTMHSIFVNRFVKRKPPAYAEVVALLNQALSAAGSAHA